METGMRTEHEDVTGWGVDRKLDTRPGVPMEAPPHPLDSAPEVTTQPGGAPVLIGRYRKQLTPVFGTGEPPRGVSGAVRRFAYRLPDHRSTRWMLLLMADRVDAVESRLREAAPPAALALLGVGLLVGATLLGAAALRRA